MKIKLMMAMLFSVVSVVYSSQAMNLQDLYKAVVKSNLNLQSMDQQVHALKDQVKAVRAQSKSQTNLYITASQTNNPPQAFMMILNQRDLNMAKMDFNDPDHTENIRTTYEMTSPLWNFGRIKAQSAAATSAVYKERESYYNAMNTIFSSLQEIYFQMLKLESFQEVLEENLALSKEYQELTDVRISQGIGIEKDRFFWNAQVAQAQKELDSLTIHQKIAKENLSYLLNKSDGNMLLASGPYKNKEVQQIETLPGKSVDYDKIPEFKMNFYQSQALSHQSEAIRAEKRPRIDFFAHYYLDMPSMDTPESSWDIGLQLSWNLSDGYRKRYQISQIKKQQQALCAMSDSIKSKVQRDLQNNKLQLDNVYHRNQSNQAIYSNAKAHLEYMKDHFSGGTALAVELNEAKIRYLQAKKELIQDTFDYCFYLEQKKIILGKLVRKYGGK